MFNILVVEDDADLNRSVCKYLNQHGYEATGCLNADAAYDAIYGTVFDLIVSDIMLTGTDGYELTETVTVGWAIIRGFSTALMHGVCTAVVGYGISYVRKRKKLFYCGTFALLAATSIYHGIFNMLVLSEYKHFGFILPGITYIPIFIQQYRYYKRNKA